ncbi:MAG TPA: 50S ribosomal protein L10 [Candidatus Paceibacterota bacterium]|nr:50S ribosomal protein L10 [Candidatus Paceibacterota bacterium]
MAITKAKKADIVAKLSDAFSKATSVVFVKFGKLSVADTSAMRKTLKSEGTQYVVAKKTLIRRALADRGYTGEIPELPGEIAIAWSADDATAPARGIYEHGKKHKDSLSIMGGVFEGAFADAAQMTAIATIPPVSVLRGMFVNIINSPRQRFAVALGEVAKLKS